MKKLLVTLLLLMLCLLCGCGSQETKDAAAPAQDAPAAAPAPEGKSPLQAAFEEGKTFELVQAELPDPGAENVRMPLSISPDGRCVIWSDYPGLYLTRDGADVPVKAAPDRGAGDPYENLEKNLSRMGFMFGQEGVCWSPDGRYALLTGKRVALKSNQTIGLMVLDTENGEVFHALALSKNIVTAEGGRLYEAKFDRTGRYVYFTGVVNSLSQGEFGLYRCDMDTYETQRICGIPALATVPGLYETPDGGCLVLGATGPENRDREAVYACGDGGAAQPSVRAFKAGTWSTRSMLYSARTGYGLMIGGPTATTADVAAMEGAAVSPNSMRISAVLEAMNIGRITPDGPDTEHYWRFADDGGEMKNVRLEPVDEGIVSILSRMANRGEYTEEEWEALQAYGEELLNAPQPRSTCGCLSPDGRYALINVGSSRELCRFFLMDVETLEIRPVDAPEGLATLAFNTPLTAKFPPGMVWNGDGTLLIYDVNTDLPGAFRLTAR
ncbi:MAG: hypothetical protein J5472_05695 [Clostridia bacterium]|nr:hypothetical protein [Clostridia bacterium]